MYVKDAYMKSMQPAVQQWPGPAIPSAAQTAAAAAAAAAAARVADEAQQQQQQPCGTFLRDIYAHSHLAWYTLT